jgi:hypothetical protein
MNYTSGAFFNGLYIDGKRNGSGRLLFTKDPNKEQFTGEWKDGIPGGGKGFYILANGDRLEG